MVETIKLDHESLASKMEIEKALHYLKTKEFDKVAILYGTFPLIRTMWLQQANIDTYTIKVAEWFVDTL